MAKLHGPLLSFRARGQIGKGIVTASWRGVAYARQYVVPANPQTVAQMATRDVFRWLNALYAHSGSLMQQPWALVSQNRPITPRNALISTNLPLLTGEININNLLFSPSARGGPAPASFSAVAGALAGEIDVELVAGTLPSGWTVNAGIFAVIGQDAPNGTFTFPPTEQDVAAPGPYTFTFSGLTAGGPYHCGGWFLYDKPDGSAAVSISAIAEANAHA